LIFDCQAAIDDLIKGGASAGGGTVVR